MLSKRIKAIGLILSTATLLMLGHLFCDQIIPSVAASSNGATLYIQKDCQRCHGISGREPIAPMYPKINGQNVEYSVNQMKDIRSGKRSNSLSEVMQPMVEDVTDAEMQAIAEYLATQ